MTKDRFLQFELLDSNEIRRQKNEVFDQIPLLPFDPLQEQYDIDNATLSKKEYQILHSVLTGHSIAEIALSQFITISAIKFRLSQIYKKFGVKNRLELIKKSSKESLQYFVDGSPIKQSFKNTIDFKLFEDKKDKFEGETDEP